MMASDRSDQIQVGTLGVRSAQIKPPSPSQPVAHWSYDHTGVVLFIGSAVTVATAIFGVFLAPQISGLVGRGLAGAELAGARAAIRDTFLKLATGVGAATAGILAWARLELSRREHHLAQAGAARAVEAQLLAVTAQQAVLTGQATDRYTRAVEQLGSDQLAVRLGALYALERLAADSEIDRATIYDVMCAWIRFRSVERDSAGAPITDGEVRQKPVVGEEIDYRAAITIVLRARPEWRINRRDLSGAVITNIVLSQTTLRGVRLGGSYLTDVNFIDIKLENIWLNEATLVNVGFGRSTLSEVAFGRATLTDVGFTDANLTDVRFAWATLIDVRFAGAKLVNVRFDGAAIALSRFAEASLTDVGFNWASFRAVDFSPLFDPGPPFERRSDNRWYTPELDESADTTTTPSTPR